MWNSRNRWIAPLWVAALGIGVLPGDGLSRPQGPRHAPAFRTGDPVVATTYFYWYDVDPANPPKDGYTTWPASWEDFTWRSAGWHKRQLIDMEFAGIDVVLPNYWGHPGQPDVPSYFGYAGLRTLVAARAELLREGRKPPGIGMFYDTTTLDADHNPTTPADRRDVTTAEGRDWFYRTITGFFDLIPEEHRALIDGKPIVFLYAISHAKYVDEGLLPYVQRRFEREFGTRLFLVKDREDYGFLVDNAGIRALSDRIARGELSEVQVLAQLLASEGCYRHSGGTPQGYVEHLTRAVLGSGAIPAPPTAGLETPAGRQALADALLTGPTREEYHRRLVADWYKLLLNRPEPLEVLVTHMAAGEFVDRGMFEALQSLRDGGPPAGVRAEILASPAFLTQAGQTTEGFIHRLYETLLFRAPAPPEVQSWGDIIRQQLADQGLPDLTIAPQVRRDIAARFVAAPEAAALIVARWNAQHLGWNPGWQGYTDGVYNWGGAFKPEFFEVASIGPGYDDSGVAGRTPSRVDRRGGGHYRDAWETLLAMHPRPSIVHIETWNEYYEATNIAECREYGRQYLEMTRAYAAQFHAR